MAGERRGRVGPPPHDRSGGVDVIVWWAASTGRTPLGRWPSGQAPAGRWAARRRISEFGGREPADGRGLPRPRPGGHARSGLGTRKRRARPTHRPQLTARIDDRCLLAAALQADSGGFPAPVSGSCGQLCRSRRHVGDALWTKSPTDSTANNSRPTGAGTRPTSSRPRCSRTATSRAHSPPLPASEPRCQGPIRDRHAPTSEKTPHE